MSSFVYGVNAVLDHSLTVLYLVVRLFWEIGMISSNYCATMARYNRWQNQSLFTAASSVSNLERKRDRGSFFGSISGTLSHLLWGDTIWMSRFNGWDAPEVGIPGSADWCSDWEDLQARRISADERIIQWADGLSDEALSGDLSWFSGALQRDVSKPKALCVVHFFNHQTHHRGQVHAMLTAAGAKPDDTDLFAMPEAV